MFTVFVGRVDVEADLQFLGLLVMKNQVKPESAGVISILRQALIRPVMVTGIIFTAYQFCRVQKLAYLKKLHYMVIRLHK